MKSFSIVIALTCMALMFFVRKEYKIAILFMSTILMTMVAMPVGGISAATSICICFLFSEVTHIKKILKRISSSVILPFIIICAISLVLCVVTSPNLQSVSGIAHFGLLELITKQFALVYAFICVVKKRDMKPLLLVSFVSLVLMTLLAYVNYVSGYSFLVDELYEETLVDYNFITAERFRVQATFVNPFDYGYICILLGVLHLYAYFDKLESPAIAIIAQICSLFGVFTCNCRTILFCYFLCMLVFAVAVVKKKRIKALILAVAVALVLLSLIMLPPLRRYILWLFSIFDPNSVTTGSSLSMRLVQLATVFYYIQGSLLFGRGVYFFNLDLGWENGSIMAADSDLYGLEGIYLNLLLERGIVGFLLFLAMMALLIVFICRNRKYGRRVYALGVTVFVLYIAFCFMTGELSSTMPAFIILGCVISNLDWRRRVFERIQYAKSEKEPVL